MERMVRDSLTENMDRIVVDSREEYDHLKSVVSKISRRARGRLKLYEGDAPIFEHFDVERQLESAFRRKVWLKSGGYIVFDETEALVAVDVNTGRHKGGKSQEESIYQVNMEAAEEIGRQLRLRNVGGLVVIDFIDMRQKRHQNAVYRQLKQTLKRDKARTNVLPLSSLGLVEMTRQRAEESIRAATYDDCPYCHGRGKVQSALSMSVDIQRHITELLRRNRNKEPLPLRVTVHPNVLDRLRREDEDVLIALEKKHKARLTFVADGGLHVEEFKITNADTDEELYASVDNA
jgi:ribonuclease G